jgi:uncharacterized protein (DUF736 family)
MNNTTDKQSEWKNREIGALWKKTASNGKSSYCTGTLEIDELGRKTKRRIIMFANKSKNNEKSPDFIIYWSNEQENGETNQPTQKSTTFAPKKVAQAAKASVENDDDIPM